MPRRPFKCSHLHVRLWLSSLSENCVVMPAVFKVIDKREVAAAACISCAFRAGFGGRLMQCKRYAPDDRYFGAFQFEDPDRAGQSGLVKEKNSGGSSDKTFQNLCTQFSVDDSSICEHGHFKYLCAFMKSPIVSDFPNFYLIWSSINFEQLWSLSSIYDILFPVFAY